MKIKIFITLLLAILAVGIGLHLPGAGYSSMTRTTNIVRIGTVSITVEVANTPQLRTLGLSNHEPLLQNHGMLFVFEQEGDWGFWMKDMHFSLDIIWADKNGIIVTIAHDVAPDTYPKVFHPSSAATYVLEVPAGFAKSHDIAEGMKLVLE